MPEQTEVEQLRKQMHIRLGRVNRIQAELNAATQQRDIADGHLEGIAQIQDGQGVEERTRIHEERDTVGRTRAQAGQKMIELEKQLDAARIALKETQDKLASSQRPSAPETDRGSDDEYKGEESASSQGGGKRNRRTRKRKASFIRHARRTRRKRRTRERLTKIKARRKTIGRKRKPVRAKRASRKI
jgi:hypothetical protein